jgi:hypothetical protein
MIGAARAATPRPGPEGAAGHDHSAAPLLDATRAPLGAVIGT